MAEDKVSDTDALKAVVDEVLSGQTHPDTEGKLRAWREQHTTKEEREASLTDEERAQQPGPGQGAGGESLPENPPPEQEHNPDTDTSPSTTPERGTQSQRKAGK